MSRVKPGAVQSRPRSLPRAVGTRREKCNRPSPRRTTQESNTNIAVVACCTTEFQRSLGAATLRPSPRTRLRLGPDYFRGLSKIALHGALRLVPELDGHAWEFDSLRRFIRYAELPAFPPMWRKAGSLIAGLGNGVMLREWGHVVVVEAGEGQIFVMLQFFVGPGAIPPARVVRLGRRPTGVRQDLAIAYLARYLERPSPEGLTGEFMRLDMVPASH
jgi:hypothetical protein